MFSRFCLAVTRVSKVLEVMGSASRIQEWWKGPETFLLGFGGLRGSKGLRAVGRPWNHVCPYGRGRFSRACAPGQRELSPRIERFGRYEFPFALPTKVGPSGSGAQPVAWTIPAQAGTRKERTSRWMPALAGGAPGCSRNRSIPVPVSRDRKGPGGEAKACPWRSRVPVLPLQRKVGTCP